MVGIQHEIFVSGPQNRKGLPGIVDAQNQLIEKAVNEGFDYLWLIQADVEVPPDSFNKLLALDVDVAQGIVPRHDDSNALICGFMDENMKVWYLPRIAVKGQILSGWVFAGMSCTLIKRRVLEAGIRFKYQVGIGEDILFMYYVQSRGFVAKVHGSVLCGHLPEQPLTTTMLRDNRSKDFKTLDVGCGHRPQGDVNIDLFTKPTAHRSADQRVCDDATLNVADIPNFVQADCFNLPFWNGTFESVVSWHLIEHVANPEGLLRELMRVSARRIEVRCPNGDHPSACDETKPLHLQRLTVSWFEAIFRKCGLKEINVRMEHSQGEPWEIVARAEVA
jgi:hypothetical protein